MKILLLSSNNGQGHNSAAKAIMESAKARGYESVMIDSMLFDSPRKSELFEKVHIEGALHAPKIFETGNRWAEKLEGSDFHSPEYRSTGKHTSRAMRFIRDNGFDTIVATHIFAAELITHLREEMDKGIKTAFVTTDYSYVPFTSETMLDAYFLPHKGLTAIYEENAPGRNYIATGIPTSRKKLLPTEKSAARETLGLPQNVPIAIVMTGSMGFGDAVPLTQELLERASKDTLVLVLCGHNANLAKTLREKYPDESRVRAIGYTDKVGLYLDAGDVLLSKPGGLSSTEAAVKEIPLVHIDPIPGWEEDNVRFFTSLGLSLTGKTPEEMAKAAAKLLHNSRAAEKMRHCQRNEINKNAADDIISALEKL
jgi:processive 1,2-diacylglycerol beta-glucosyltransferase